MTPEGTFSWPRTRHEALDFATPLSCYLAEPEKPNLFEPELSKILDAGHPGIVGRAGVARPGIVGRATVG
jgi:hypothetical protein